jgi:DNA-binding GntR family transcriptional regulator
MSTNRTKMTKEEWELFQKAREAMRLFNENPDAMRRFVDALKKGDFSEARMSLNASLGRGREEGGAAADPSGVPSGKRKK